MNIMLHTLFYSNQIRMNRSTWITSKARMSSGTSPEIQRMQGAERMTNGGNPDQRFLPMGFLKSSENGCNIRRNL